MLDQSSEVKDEKSARVAVYRMAQSALVARSLYTVAEIGVADHLPESEIRDVETLAASSGALEDPLYRIMRMLSSRGVFEEVSPRRFRHTPMSVVLRRDHPSKTRSAVMFASGPLWWRGLDHLTHTVRTGETSFDASVGRSFFDFLRDHPEHAKTFGEAMASFHAEELDQIVEAFDFASFRSIVDIGGGTGDLLARILRRHEQSSGVLFETPQISRIAREHPRDVDLTDRFSVVEGDFFESFPENHDLYLMSRVLHDWDESKCRVLLANCRRAMKRGARLLVIEMLLPDNGSSHPAKTVDVTMLAMTGGRERTEEEYRSLFEETGLRLEAAHRTSGPACLLEVCRDDETAASEAIESLPIVPWV